MAGDLSKSPTALGKGAGYCPAVEDASFLLALQRLWDSPLHLLPFLCSSGRPLISKQSRGKSVGRIFFFSGATRSPFSTSEELEE